MDKSPTKNDRRMSKQIFQGRLGGGMPKGSPRKRCLDNIEDDNRRLSVCRWKRVGKNRREWGPCYKKAQTLHGL